MQPTPGSIGQRRATPSILVAQRRDTTQEGGPVRRIASPRLVAQISLALVLKQSQFPFRMGFVLCLWLHTTPTATANSVDDCAPRKGFLAGLRIDFFQSKYRHFLR